MRKWIFAMVLLAGCAQLNQLDNGLSNFQGKNIRVAINVLGYPDAVRTMMGDRIFIWYSATRKVSILHAAIKADAIKSATHVGSN